MSDHLPDLLQALVRRRFDAARRLAAASAIPHLDLLVEALADPRADERARLARRDGIGQLLALPDQPPTMVALALTALLRLDVARQDPRPAAPTATRLRLALTPTLPVDARILAGRALVAAALAAGDFPGAAQLAQDLASAMPEDSDGALEFRSHWIALMLNELDLRGVEAAIEQLAPHAGRLQHLGIDLDWYRSAADRVAGRGDAVIARAAQLPELPRTAQEAALLGLAGESHLMLGRIGPAEGVLDRLRRAGAIAGTSHDALAVQIHLASGDLAAVDRRLRRLGSADGRTALPLDHLRRLAANLALCRQRAQEARHLLERIDPGHDRPGMLVTWMRLHRLEGDADRAVGCLGRALATRPARSVAGELCFAKEITGADMALLWARADPTASSAAMPGTPRRAEDGLLIGDSAIMVALRAQIDAYAPGQLPVLLVGETGTGKELAARHLHRAGSHPDEPFVALNCAALPDSLAESELFGHAEGAFTGASTNRDGLIAAAGTGTLLLDEINSMPLRLQSLLLRLLETGEYRPVGSTHTAQARCRFVVATNQHLHEAVATGTFREDLAYRLERLVVHLPPLREHPEDIPALARHLIRSAVGRDDLELDESLLAVLRRHPWPGNVRELRNCIERMAVLSAGRQHLTAQDAAGLGQSAPARTRPAAAVVPPPRTARTGLVVPGPPHARQRRQRLLDLLAMHPHLYLADARPHIAVSHKTLTADLAALVASGHLRRVATTGNHKTSYWVRVD